MLWNSTFPRVMGYRVELPNDRLTAKFTADSILNLTPELTGPSQTQNAGIVGEERQPYRRPSARYSAFDRALPPHYALAYTKWRDPGEEAKLHLFGQLKRIVKDWLDTCLICKGDTYPAQILYRHLADMACDRVTAAITAEAADRAPIKVLLDPYNPVGSTSHVNFNTSKTSRWETGSRRCHINWVILDSDWEAEFCRVAENHPRVRAYVKNHNLGFDVPYRLWVTESHASTGPISLFWLKMATARTTFFIW
jgi:type III restriction enzyme